MPPRAAKHDPYRAFKFRVRLDERTVAGVSKVSALGRTVAATEVKQGGDMLAAPRSPGQVNYEEVTLERGLSVDREFEDWADAVTAYQADPGTKGFKRTVHIDVYAQDGNPSQQKSQPAFSYRLHKCWVSRYSALPALDAGAGAIAIESLSLQHEGWERVT